jgi:hypothetical protein
MLEYRHGQVDSLDKYFGKFILFVPFSLEKEKASAYIHSKEVSIYTDGEISLHF